MPTHPMKVNLQVTATRSPSLREGSPILIMIATSLHNIEGEMLKEPYSQATAAREIFNRATQEVSLHYRIR